jgi:hypothetical protein
MAAKPRRTAVLRGFVFWGYRVHAAMAIRLKIGCCKMTVISDLKSNSFQ